MNRLALWLGICLSVVLGSTALGQEQLFSQTVGNTKVGDVKKGEPLQVGYIFWGGDVPTFYANGGTKTQKDSLYGKLGLDLNLVAGDDFPQQVRDYMSGKTPFLRCTMGMLGLASEVLGSDPRTKPVVFMQLTWSKGDHLVVKPGIKTLADLKGKTVALQTDGPHIKLLDDALKIAKLSWSDIHVIFCKDLSGNGDAPANLFRKRNDIDAAFTVTPDMLGLTGGLQNTGSGGEGTVKGARVLLSTSELSRSIADIYVCRSDFWKSDQETVYKFAAGYMKACEEVLAMKALYETKGSKEYTTVLKMAQDIYGKTLLPTIEEDAVGLVDDAAFVGYPGNIVFFTQDRNPVGFDAQSKEVVDLAVSQGYAKIRSGFLSANIDYSSKTFVGYLKETAVVQGNRFAGEAVEKEIEELNNGGNLDDHTIISFTIQFQPNQTTFNIDTYGAEFKRVVDILGKAGNGVIDVRGHSDPTKTLSDFVKAGLAKGTLKQSGTTGNYSYYIEGKMVDLVDTKNIVRMIDDGAVDGAPNGISPRDTMTEALNLSKQRSEAVKSAIIKYASTNNIRIDPSQIKTTGIGIKEPLIFKPKNMGESAQNMRVEFRLIRVTAEPTKQGDFDF